MILTRNVKIRLAAVLLLILLTVILTACNTNVDMEDQADGYEADTFAMGTVISQKVYGENGELTSNQVIEKMKYLEGLLTFNAPVGDINEINVNAGIKDTKLDPETIKVIKKAQEAAELSSGVFDITVGPLVKAWGIGTDYARIPAQEELQKLLPLVDYRSLQVDQDSAGLKKAGQLIDLGGIAKGYAGDAAIEIYKQNGIESAYISLGGNVVTLGSKPDGSPWKIGISNPRPKGSNANQIVGAVKVTDKAVVTAGNYQRYFEEGGQRYHHILDPTTGYPAKSDLMSVTLVTDSSLAADALDTAVFILGFEKGKELIRKYGGVEAIFITQAKKIYVTDGLKDKFEFQDESQEFEYVN
ncbi:FAD:protein FMN transferase [Desulfosporosinus lacus]|uniref:FAD:protein FMN transferase n=1 Tax=Desulfosporosinus lacus DSM 15449 TaxID=1121420 RepID=A0A1M6DMT0_9FIRM|nr:FAD:protein FMN transferase [Desulfosporosinus lacus]SHI74502.1 thiamine biosynthesis lipoprotein [Desulfosporosinus lacus DSM 15449]